MRKLDVLRSKRHRIPKRGNLSWLKKYADPGQCIRVFPLLERDPGTGELNRPFSGVVERVTINNFGRVSYQVAGRLVLTEELVPEHHKRVTS